MLHRFAIIGCGRIAERHAREIMKHGKLCGVCDIIPEKASKFATLFNTDSFLSLDELLKEKKPEMVVICTPNGLHAEHAIQSLNGGAHVLCEKPMSISVKSAYDMVEAANRAGKKLFIVKQNRYNPPVQLVKNYISEGKLGKIFGFQVNCFWNRPTEYYTDSWHGSNAMDGGILFTQFSHFIDLLYWLLGDIKEVSGWRKNDAHKDVIEFEDAGIAIILMENGAMGTLNYTINTFKQNMEGSVTIFGENGTIKIGGQYLNKLSFFSVLNESVPELAPGNPPNQYGSYEGSMSNHDKMYENLIKGFGDPGHSFLEAAEAIKTITIIEKIYASSSFRQ